MISLFTHLFMGFIMSYIGLLPPGMMNMTVVDRTISTGLLTAVKFSLGASVVVGVQSLVALTFTQLFVSNPSIIEGLRNMSIPFYFGYCTIMEIEGWIKLEQPLLILYHPNMNPY